MLDQILALAAQLPSGIPDPDADYKLAVEMNELLAAEDFDARLGLCA